MMIGANELIMYLRKSRSDSPDMTVEEVLARHEALLQEYAVREYGERIPEERIFREVVSGETIADRPVIKAVMRLIESNSIKGVVVVEPQRLSRGDLEDCGRIVNAFRYSSTSVITPAKVYDLSDEYDRKFFELELTRGNDYLEYTKKILRRGREASVKQGNYIGSVAPFGYRKARIGEGKDSYCTLEVIPEEADAVRLMYDLFANSAMGYTNIARQIDKTGVKPRKADRWSPAAIKDILENPIYIGYVRWNRRPTEKVIVDGNIVKTRPRAEESMRAKGKHEAIVTEEIFNKAQSRKGKNPRVVKGAEIRNPFAGLLFCGTCGRAMSLRIDQKPYNYCYSGFICDNQANCHTRSVLYNLIVSAVISDMESRIETFEIAASSGDYPRIEESTIKVLKSSLDKLKSKDERQKDAFDDGVYTKEEYLLRNAKLQKEIAEVEREIVKVESRIGEAVDYGEKIALYSDCISMLTNPDASGADKNRLLKECIKKVTYYNNTVASIGGKQPTNEFRLKIDYLS